MGRPSQQILDAVPDGVVVLDARGVVERVNAEACRILSLSAEAARGRKVEDLPEGPLLAPLARSALARGAAAVAHDQRLGKDEAPGLSVDLTASPIFDAQGRTDGVLLSLRDRTIGDALQRVWTERERLAAFGRIASGIAHEVKNPLGGIRGAAELLHARAGDAKSREIAEMIVREVDRIATLVNDFLVFSRSDAVRMRPINLHELLDQVLGLLAMDPVGSGTRVERRFDPSIPELRADPDRLIQVFLNLIRNALEAMAGSEALLEIETRMNLDHRVDLGSGRRVPTVSVEIRDGGPGIPADVLEQVSTPFFTTKSQGTGLGLAVARHFVAAHDGTLEITSRPGRGTRVRVTLPLRRNA